MHLLWVADRCKYTPFMDDLRNNFLKGRNNYPKTVLEAYSLLLHHKNNATTYSGNMKYMESQSFAKDGEVEDINNKTPCGGGK